MFLHEAVPRRASRCRPTILGVQDPFYRRVLTTPLHSFWGSGYSGETPPHPAWDSRERREQ